ncbi:MAG: hypothetical protein ACMG6H_13705 [Acidobacteriota bacterium]
MLRPKPPLTWHLTFQLDAPEADRTEATRQTISVLKNRLSAFGVSNFEVKPEGDAPQRGRILVNLPATQDRDRLVHLITDEGRLELNAVVSPPSPAPPAPPIEEH